MPKVSLATRLKASAISCAQMHVSCVPKCPPIAPTGAC